MQSASKTAVAYDNIGFPATIGQRLHCLQVLLCKGECVVLSLEIPFREGLLPELAFESDPLYTSEIPAKVGLAQELHLIAKLASQKRWPYELTGEIWVEEEDAHADMITL